jgi:hypothetical protein
LREALVNSSFLLKHSLISYANSSDRKGIACHSTVTGSCINRYKSLRRLSVRLRLLIHIEWGKIETDLAYSHDVYDVTCGSILGFSIAYFSYRRYFPRLRSVRCDQPYPSREDIFNKGFGKIRDDEETAREDRHFDGLSDDDNED